MSKSVKSIATSKVAVVSLDLSDIKRIDELLEDFETEIMNLPYEPIIVIKGATTDLFDYDVAVVWRALVKIVPFDKRVYLVTKRTLNEVPANFKPLIHGVINEDSYENNGV